MLTMVWLYYLFLLASDLCGLTFAALALPGLWLMLAGAAVYAWLTHGKYLGWHSLLALLVLALAAEAGEIFFGGAGAKRAGGSAWGIAGGLVGAVVGGIVFTPFIPIPILGTIIGICLGSFVGAFAVELLLGQPVGRSVRIGFGAAKGRLAGIIGKIGVGVLMVLVSCIAAFPIQCSSPAPTTISAPASSGPTTLR